MKCVDANSFTLQIKDKMKPDASHIMVDIETYSSRSNGLIRSIGAVEFNIQEETVLNPFHCGVNVESSLLVGLHIDEDTIKWWKKQKYLDDLISLIPQYPIQTALNEFRIHFSKLDMENTYIWSHGSNFDCVLLTNAYLAIVDESWWKYKNVRDTRTLFDLGNYTYKAKGGHNALEDAIYQAEAVIECMGSIYKAMSSGG